MSWKFKNLWSDMHHLIKFVDILEVSSGRSGQLKSIFLHLIICDCLICFAVKVNSA